MQNKKDICNPDSMLANLDRVMRQLRRRPQGTHRGGRGTYRLLKVILESPGLPTKELAEMMDIRQASLNEILLRLENEGMIRRDRDENDQRVRIVYLEPEGIDHLNHIQEIRFKINNGISAVLTSEEIHELSFLAGKLADGLEQIYAESEVDNKVNKE